MSLAGIMALHGTDKLGHGYAPDYERHFGPLTGLALNIMEIGVGGYGSPEHGGEGLKTWADYFPSALVHGIDCFTKRLDLCRRIKIWRGMQSDTAFLDIVHQEAGPFDIVIDDGSHQQQDVIQSFRHLFPLMNPGGIYVIEDIGTSYDVMHGGGQDLRIESANVRSLLVAMIEAIHWEFWSEKDDNSLIRLVKSVHVSKELAFIYRQ